MMKPLRRIHFLRICVGLLLIAGIVFYGKDLKSWLKSSRNADEKALFESERLAEEERIAEKSPRNDEALEALRDQVRESLEAGSYQALTQAYQLFREPGATPEDRAWALSLAFDAGDLTNATQIAPLLTREDVSSPEVHCQLVRGFLMSRKYEDAIRLADDPARKYRDPKVDLLLADSLVGAKAKWAREAATGRLRKLLLQPNRDLALEAMNLLSQHKDQWVHKTMLQAALERFQDDPDLNATEKLNLEFFQIKLGQRDLNEAVTDAIENHKESHFPELIRWLSRLEQHEEVVDVTGEEELPLNAEPLRLRLNSLEKLKKWEELEAELEKPDLAISEPLLRVTQALVAGRLGDKNEAGRLLQLAMDAARSDSRTNWFYRIANAAGRLGETDRQMESIMAGFKHPFGMAPDPVVLGSLSKWMRDREDGERLVDVYAILLRRDPQNPLLLNNYAYQRALHGSSETSDASFMRKLVERYPGKENVRNTLGFVLLSQGDPKACLEVLDAAFPSPEEFSNFGKAVYARALHDDMKKEEALTLSQSVDWDQLSRAEVKKLALPAP